MPIRRRRGPAGRRSRAQRPPPGEADGPKPDRASARRLLRAQPGRAEAALRERAVFFRATSTLRIARNGWLSRLERTALVAEALALLALCE